MIPMLHNNNITIPAGMHGLVRADAVAEWLQAGTRAKRAAGRPRKGGK